MKRKPRRARESITGNALEGAVPITQEYDQALSAPLQGNSHKKSFHSNSHNKGKKVSRPKHRTSFPEILLLTSSPTSLQWTSQYHGKCTAPIPLHREQPKMLFSRQIKSEITVLSNVEWYIGSVMSVYL